MLPTTESLMCFLNKLSTKTLHFWDEKMNLFIRENNKTNIPSHLLLIKHGHINLAEG